MSSNNNNDLTLYSNPGSVSTKVKLILKYLGIPFTNVHINTANNEQHTPEYKKINIHGKVPVLVDRSSGQEVTIFESGAIVLYILRKYPNELIPDIATDLAGFINVFKWLEWQTSTVSSSEANVLINKIFTPEPIPSIVEKYEGIYLRALTTLDEQLASNKYIAGDKLSAADIVVYPHLAYLQLGIIPTFFALKNIERYYKELEQIPIILEAKNTLFEAVSKHPVISAFIQKNKSAPAPVPAPTQA
ncbi:hypothetical protein CYY_007108 [Polysphondylium violaceum]|uniref:Glutathione S-transferase n=1 Tax=Polysphondylium violaceum TaxID=133409 RepID=A0A8J4PP43_9MYCE|nr:hypothetical protein CYY_007108 [Polysphondylium violaceum]